MPSDQVSADYMRLPTPAKRQSSHSFVSQLLRYLDQSETTERAGRESIVHSRDNEQGTARYGDGWLCRCGDGHKDEPEHCDDGNEAEGDGCSSTCQVEFGYHCGDDSGRCVVSEPLSQLGRYLCTPNRTDVQTDRVVPAQAQPRTERRPKVVLQRYQRVTHTLRSVEGNSA